jgi:hypothetical protein
VVSEDSPTLATFAATEYGDSVRYEIQVPHPDGSIERFDIEHDELLGVGSLFTQFTTTYEVTSILPGSGDSVGAEAKIVSGPAQQF